MQEHKAEQSSSRGAGSASQVVIDGSVEVLGS